MSKEVNLGEYILTNQKVVDVKMIVINVIALTVWITT